jgi:rubrerythrin
MNVFDCAIKIEEETKKYYEGLQAESDRQEIKNLFSLLAASEDQLKASLLRLKGMSPEKNEMKALDGTVCSFRPPLTQRELMDELVKDPDLYRFSVTQEEREIEMFESLSAQAASETAATTLRMIAEAERRHLNVMENIYDFVEAPRNFLVDGEFSNRREL